MGGSGGGAPVDTGLLLMSMGMPILIIVVIAAVIALVVKKR